MPTKQSTQPPASPPISNVLAPYKKHVALLIFLALISNGLNLAIPRLLAQGITNYTTIGSVPQRLLVEFLGISVLIFIFIYLQNIVQTYTSELVARDLRRDLTEYISRQSYAFIQTVTPSVLLTNLTSDIDAVKGFVAQAVSTIVSSVFLIIGASVLLLITDWKLALVVLMIVPIIGFTFGFVLSKVRVLFGKGQAVIDWLNKVINESILGAALIRVLNSQKNENEKFAEANRNARDIGLQILNHFVFLIPIITFVANMAILAILLLGGKFVIDGAMTIGDIAAFNSYVTILIFPIIMIGFMSNVIARSSASYARIMSVMQIPDSEKDGSVPADVSGPIVVEDLTLKYGEKIVLDDISFTIKPKTKTAIIGPTAAGKTQLLYMLSGLHKPTEGKISYSGTALAEFDKNSFYKKVGLVFQESSTFNMSLRENIAFNTTVTDADLEKAIETAELHDFIDGLPHKLDTIISERGSSLSGGQKQRIMLARALALDPQVLLLDDFTARVDTRTEQKILNNLEKNYPTITLISVTQKISSIMNYDHIILLMEGEIIAQGTHKELLKTSPEYVQLYESQKSTNTYELHAE